MSITIFFICCILTECITQKTSRNLDYQAQGGQLLRFLWREILRGWWEAFADGGQWQPRGRTHRGWVYRILRERPNFQVRWMDIQGCWQVLGGWQGGRRPACGSAFLPSYCGRWAPIQPGGRCFGWHHSQEAQGGRNLRSWWNWFRLHLLWPRGTTLCRSHQQLLEEGLAARHAISWVGRWAFAAVVDHWLHQFFSTWN